MALASVAVKIPATIPPITITMSKRLGIARKKVRTPSESPGRPATGYRRRTAITPPTSMSARPNRMPGTYPATNSAAIETPPLAREYTIRTLLGGIRRPVADPVMVTATLYSRS